MFGISLPELLVIFTLVLVLFGPEKLPEIARTLGKLSADLKRTSDGIRREFYNSVYKPADEAQGKLSLVAKDLNAIKEEVARELRSNLTTPPASPISTLQPDSQSPEKTEQNAETPADSTTHKP